VCCRLGHPRRNAPIKEPEPLHVIDAEQGNNSYPALLKSTPDGHYLEGLDRDAEAFESDLYISPGWIDLHTHVYDGVASLSVHPDRAGLETGVHVVVDAGSAGEGTISAFRQYVAPSAQTCVRAWLNISSVGLIHLRELSDLSLIDVERTVSAVLSNRQFVCGIKVRSSGAIVENMGLQPLKLARLVARLAEVPLMVHIGEPPPLIEEMLELVEEGDVLTHCFHGKVGYPWLSDGRPIPALKQALDRGVLLDIGHGAASFSYEVAERAIAAGFQPHTISTDLHVRNLEGPVYDLATTMTKLMACGMSLHDVIRSVTVEPAKLIGERNWLRSDGRVERATIFRLTDKPLEGRVYEDSLRSRRPIDRYIVPVRTIIGDK
jgi:dihydroorotase